MAEIYIGQYKIKQKQMHESAPKTPTPIISNRNNKHAYLREQHPTTPNPQHLRPSPNEAAVEHRHHQPEINGPPLRRNEPYGKSRHTRYEEDDDFLFTDDFQVEYNADDSQEFPHEQINGGEIFQLDTGKFSPIINTYIDDNEGSQGRELLFRNEMQRKVRSHKNISNSRTNTNQRVQSPRWKQFVNPQINKYYEEIMRSQGSRGRTRTKQHSQYSQEIQNQNQSPYQPNQGRNMKRLKSENNFNVHHQKVHNFSSGGDSQIKSTRNKSTMQNQLELQSQKQMETLKKQYEDRISVLEHQNTNLKDELFYLRAAILAQYESRLESKTSKSGSLQSLG